MELNWRSAELLLQVLTGREETNSVALASNKSFSGWTKAVTDPRLSAAIVDRLTFGGNIIKTGTVSYRLARGPGGMDNRPVAKAATGPRSDRAPRPHRPDSQETRRTRSRLGSTDAP